MTARSIKSGLCPFQCLSELLDAGDPFKQLFRNAFSPVVISWDGKQMSLALFSPVPVLLRALCLSLFKNTVAELQMKDLVLTVTLGPLCSVLALGLPGTGGG